MPPVVVVEALALAVVFVLATVALAFVVADVRAARELEDALTSTPISLDGMNPEQIIYLLKVGLIDQERAIAAVNAHNRRDEPR